MNNLRILALCTVLLFVLGFQQESFAQSNPKINKAMKRAKKPKLKPAKKNKSKSTNYDRLARKGKKDRKKIAAFDDGESKEFDKVEKPASAADRTYNKLGFKASIEQYLAKKNLTDDDKLKIGNAYRLVHDTENAEEWYSQAVDQSEYPEDFLHYAQVLQSNGKAEEAAKYFKLFEEKNTNEDSWENLAQVFAENVTQEGRFRHTDTEIRNEFNINSVKLEYSPAFYKDGVIFVSTKKPEKMKLGKDAWIDENFMSLYRAKIADNGLLEESEAFSYDITSKYHEGPVTFTKGFSQIYFTRNHFNGSRKNNSDGIMKLQIYTSEFDGDKWSKPKEININTREYEEAHPTLTADGETMYFSSDRPNGHGGMDLYVTNFNGKEWSEPENLGPEINTAGNEVFPFIHESGMLLYASNGLEGLGGLDIYYTNQNKDQEWAKATNMGTPFNSEKDDFGMIVNPEGNYGYLTSARKNGNGADDIYSFPLPYMPSKRELAKICVFDEKTGEKIPNASVKVALFSSDLTLNSSCFGEGTTFDLEPTNNEGEYLLVLKSVEAEGEPQSLTTDKDGYLELEINEKTNYRFETDIEGYDLKSKIITYLEFENSELEICIPVNKTPDCPDLAGTVWNESSGTILSEANISLVNSCSGVTTTFTSDAEGNFNFPCLECGCKYFLKAEKNNFSQDFTEFIIEEKSCTKENSVHKDLRLNINIEEQNVASSAPKVGDVIVLENIFYDFDKYYIRDDAKEELNHVVDLMNQYPEMVIELGSHTDARGSHGYNELLSSNRAKSAVEYIVSSGIDKRRIVAKGYGENVNRNHCSDGVKCTEEQHQFNRRTEVKVIHFPNQDIRIEYNDNRPDRIDRAPADVIGINYDSRGSDAAKSQRFSSTNKISEGAFEDRTVNIKPVKFSQSVSAESNGGFEVIVGSYSSIYNAEKKLKKVTKLGFEGQIVPGRNVGLQYVSIGSYSSAAEAESVVNKAITAGLKAIVTKE